jgi:dTDP-glucose 4,6-dehydratase
MTHSKPILVLGSNSFSATSFIGYLLSEGYKVIGVSRSEEVANVFRPYKTNSNLANFSFLQINVRVGAAEIAELVKKYQIEYIFNFAAQSMVAQSWEYPEDWYQTNVVALAELGNMLMKEKSIKKFIHFTTPEVYGSTSGWLKESFDFSPSTPYAVSRAAGDWHLKCLFENYGFPVIFTRAANVYGPGQQLYRIIPRTILAALLGQKLPLHGGGKSIRSFIHIKDVSSALEAILKNGVTGDTYHVSTDSLTSISDLVETLANLLNVDFEELVERGPERPGKDFAYQLSSEKIRNELGWGDRIDLNTGLTDTLEWAQLHLGELRGLPIDYKHKR